MVFFLNSVILFEEIVENQRGSIFKSKTNKKLWKR